VCENKRRKAEKWLCASVCVCECMQAESGSESAVGVSTLAPRERRATYFWQRSNPFSPLVVNVGGSKEVCGTCNRVGAACRSRRAADRLTRTRERAAPSHCSPSSAMTGEGEGSLSLSPPVCSAGCLLPLCVLCYAVGWMSTTTRSLARSLTACSLSRRHTIWV
jgi:hypothetical protein